METSYRLPKKKYDYWTVVGFMVLFGGIFAFTMVVAFVASMRDKWVFNHMTDAQHLWEAKKSTPELGDVYLALRHLGAISPGSPEARESKGVEATVRQKESELSAAESERKAAQAKNAQAANDAREARAASVKQFESALKNIGYDLSVEASDDNQSEVVITSQEFSEKTGVSVSSQSCAKSGLLLRSCACRDFQGCGSRVLRFRWSGSVRATR